MLTRGLGRHRRCHPRPEEEQRRGGEQRSPCRGGVELPSRALRLHARVHGRRPAPPVGEKHEERVRVRGRKGDKTTLINTKHSKYPENVDQFVPGVLTQHEEKE